MLDPSTNPTGQPDEDLLAMLGLHPAQMAVAHGLASGAIHPQHILNATTPRPTADLSAGPPAPGLIASPDAGPPPIAPPVAAAAGNPKLDADRAELARKESTGSGVDQFRHNHPILGTIAKIAGGIGSAMFPAIGAAIPGTDLHHQVLLNQDRAKVGEDIGQEKSQAGIAETGARTAHEQAEADALKNPIVKPKEEQWETMPGFTGPNGEPLEIEKNSGSARFVGGIPGAKTSKTTTDKPDNPQQQLLDAESAVQSAKTPEEKAAAQTRVGQLKQGIADYAASSQAPQRPDKPGASSARSDKSYAYNNDKLDKLGKPIEDATQRMGRLRETLAQGTPQADALVAPELLTIMAGGQGSGLRMNEAEISRVVGGRSAWENLKANMQHWSTDPEAARSITPDQQKQIRALVEAVNGKLTKKQQALDSARDALLNSDDPAEHRKIVTGAHHALTQVDTGDEQQQKTDKQNDPLGIR